MLRSYLTAGLRNLRSDPAFATINILGLAMGMSVCLLLILLIQDQLSHDRFHRDADRIYRLIADQLRRGGGVAATPAHLAGVLEREVPEIDGSLRIGQIRTDLVYEGRSLKATGLYAEPTFFELFDFDLVTGEPRLALSKPSQVVLSERMSSRVFADQNPMGKTVTLDGIGDLVVSGIVRTTGQKSHLKFDVLASFPTLEGTEGGRNRLQDEADFWSFATYLRLRPGSNTVGLEEALARISAEYAEMGRPYELRIQALTDIAMGPLLANEISSYSMPFFLVAVLICLATVVLVASGFNYVGLSIARSIARNREVGIRKTVGAGRTQIVVQFLVESVLLTVFSLLLAYSLLPWLVASFNGLGIVQLFQVHLSPEHIGDASTVGLFLLFSIGVGLLAGAYPALYLSGARPSQVLRGSRSDSALSRMVLRKSLTLLQLVFSLVFVVTTSLVYRQLTFVVDFDFGFETDNVVHIDLQGTSYTTLSSELLQHPDVVTVGGTSLIPAGSSYHTLTVKASAGDTVKVSTYNANAELLEALDIEVIAGRPFSPTYGGALEGVIISEAAVVRLGFEDPGMAVGQVVHTNLSPDPLPVIGVVADYQFHQIVRPTGPVLFYHGEEGFRYATVRLHENRVEPFLRDLPDIWKRLDSVHPVAYHHYTALLRDNAFTRVLRDMSQIAGTAAAIAVTIAMLGMFSMAAHNTRLRTKEVGVRKVLGAGTRELLWLLSREYVLLTAAAIVIGAPLASAVNGLWLSHLANHVEIDAALIASSAVPLLTLSLLVVGGHTLRVTSINPVDALLSE